MKDVIELFKAARRVSTPLVAFSTSDQFALARQLFKAIGNGDSDVPKITHDVVRGLKHVNQAGEAMLKKFKNELPRAVNPAGALELAEKFDEGSMLVMFNAHRYVDADPVAQGILNLRDVYCENRRTLVLTGPSFRMPSDLQDVVLFDDPLPSDDQLRDVMGRVLKSAYGEDDKRAVDPEWVNAARGLSAFACEQVFAMSLNKKGVDLDDLWERKKATINQTRGLKFVRDGSTFAELGGLDAFKDYVKKLRHKPGVIVFADELDKSMAGAQSDNTGVSQDFHGTMLSWMQDNYYSGIIAVGPPGSGKTAAGMAIGPELGIPTIVLDMNAMKTSLLGESERAIREALKVIDSVAGKDGAFVFGTCNSDQHLAPEFKRRFRGGQWFFDLPTKEERAAIWNIHKASYAVKGETPRDENWTGAEIKNCCDKAWQLDCTLEEAARYVIPLAESNAGSIDNLRESAHGKWLSASYPGPYVGVPTEVTDGGPGHRKVTLLN